MKLRKCSVCKKYTVKESCCSKNTEQAGYKFLKILKNFDGCQKSQISEV